MTADEFRRIALSFPEAIESAHMGHPDFRFRDRIFATLGPDETWGMVKLTAEQQTVFMREAASVFRPAAGAWGRGGSTIVQLDTAATTIVRKALTTAWQNISAKRRSRTRKTK